MTWEAHMTLCPVAIAVGCKKCPVFSLCPVKGVIGDVPSGAADATSAKKTTTAAKGKAKK
jgi:hypothetical protein